MKRIWTDEELALLCKNYPDCTPIELSFLFPDRTKKAIKERAKTLKLKKTIQYFHFTEDKISELKEIYHNTQNQVLAEKYGCSIHTIENKGCKLNLKKDKEFIAKMASIAMEDPNHGGRNTLFKQGDAPPNKGKKQTEFMSPEAIERTKATRFQTGQTIWNHKEVGYERIDSDGYIYVKVEEPNVFKLKQRIVWEENFGAIPEGYNVQFKDKNPLNTEPDNLYIISRADQLKNENSMYARYPKEMQLAIQAKGALNRQINKLTKLQNEHN